MIPLSQQVCSKDLAMRFKELGVYNESYFHWNFNPTVPEQGWFLDDENLAYDPDYSIHAYGVAELGAMLPIDVQKDDCFYNLKIERYSKRGSNSWNVKYSFYDASYEAIIHLENEKSIADAMAKMLVYLIENHLYDLKNP